jgi:hypothetical protein
MTAFIAFAVLAAWVAWGATIAPGRRFSWAMYSGSSKAFLWLREPVARWATMDELRLGPQAHYLRESDLRLIVQDGLPALDGLIVGTRASASVAYDGAGGLVTQPLERDEVLAALAAALRRYECPPR